MFITNSRCWSLWRFNPTPQSPWFHWLQYPWNIWNKCWKKTPVSRPTPPARHINHGGGLLCTQMSLPWSSRATKIQVNETLDLIADNGQSSLVALGIMTNIKKTVRIAEDHPKWLNILARHISLNILSATQFWDFVMNWILGQPVDLIAATGQSLLVALGEPFVTFFSPYPLKPTVMHYYSPIKSHGHGHIIPFQNQIPCFCFISSFGFPPHIMDSIQFLM